MEYPFDFKYVKLVILSISTLVVFNSYCYYCHAADLNLSPTLSCYPGDNSTALINSYQTNLNNLLTTLSENAPLHNGFYNATSSSKNSNKIYGLVQCRADVSAQDCANCTKEAIKTAMSDCPKSNQVAIWFRWCFLRYSIDNFFGVLHDESALAVFYETSSDDLDTVSRGINLMGGLAATAPNQPLMFQTAIVDVGKRGKRFGMAQCSRDMSRSNCGKCLSSQAKFLATTIGNNTAIEVYGKSCNMWYNDYQFYFNISTAATNDTTRSSENKGAAVSESKGAAVGITLATLGFLSVL